MGLFEYKFDKEYSHIRLEFNYLAMQYAYYYAEIDETGMCIGVQDRTDQEISEFMIPIPVYDEEYIFKYYIDGNWYEDAEGTIPWQSSLI